MSSEFCNFTYKSALPSANDLKLLIDACENPGISLACLYAQLRVLIPSVVYQEWCDDDDFKHGKRRMGSVDCLRKAIMYLEAKQIENDNEDLHEHFTDSNVDTKLKEEGGESGESGD